MSWPVPLAVAQILRIHLFGDGPADIVLGFEPKGNGVMEEKSKSFKEPILSPLGLSLFGAISIGSTIVAPAIFGYNFPIHGGPGEGRSLVFACFAANSLMYTIACRRTIGLFKNWSFDSRKSLSYIVCSSCHTIRRNAMNLKPLHDWAVIRPAVAEAKTAGGLYIPDTAQEKPQEGVVEAIGPGAYEEEKAGGKKESNKERRFIPTTVKPGERVLYEKYAGKTYTIGGEDLVLVRERDIIGVLSGK